MSDSPRKPFFDTNILIYAVSQNDSRAEIAEELLSRGGIISVQVLNEFAATASRKLNMSWGKIAEALGAFRALSKPVMPLTVELHDTALEVAARYGYHIYDALIVAAAIEAGCDVVFSEDMQEGQRIGKLTIRNPFARHRRN
ncbi:MAG TPA: PIN domain-containing protein [Acidobacteriaceae bacterium]|nr:PIN domain-containing protein [Acidobacteriaceae bacterium]